MADNQGAEKVARGLLEAFNATDWSAFKKSLAQNSVYEEYGTQRRIEGADAIVVAFQAWKAAWPDVKGTVDNVLSGGNTVALEVIWKGTHTGPLETPSGTVPASGKAWMLRTFWTIEVQSDKLQNSGHYFDILTLLQQIGAAPA